MLVEGGGGKWRWGVGLNLTCPPRCARAAISMCAEMRRGGTQVKSAMGGGGEIPHVIPEIEF